MKCATEIHGTKRLLPNTFSDLLNSCGFEWTDCHNIWHRYCNNFGNPINYHRFICFMTKLQPAKLLTSPSSYALLYL